MENEPTFSVKESTIVDIIGAIAARHDAEHRHCDYDVCDDPICAAGWELEKETAVFDWMSDDGTNEQQLNAWLVTAGEEA